jgi:hypothetical protein
MRGHISPDSIFLPLEQIMRELLYKLLDEYSQQNVLRSWTTHLKGTPKKDYFQSTTFKGPLPTQKIVKIEPIRKKIKPGIDYNYSLLWHLTHLTMIDWTNTDGLKTCQYLHPT